MISVILYGRNDAHGYNLHKRAAISLNCIAEVLTHADDEIIFVDCNTPDDMPTFPEAIQDTLTARAKRLLRVLRLRPALFALHKRGTHLPVSEPLCRNLAIRRSNPANRWILSTNTDMVFVPRLSGRSLSDIVADLPDGFYGLPRFEVPEGLWESVDRSDPTSIIATFARWGRTLHLNEAISVEPHVRFDAPGDFQLMLRDEIFALHGFHEEMVFGFHVDSNLCKRFYLLHGEIRSLLDRVFAYHCDHTRRTTIYHRTDYVGNDQKRFVDDVATPYLPEQAASWGLPGVALEELRLTDAFVARLARVGERLLPGLTVPFTEDACTSRAYNQGLFYDTAHAFPYVADHLLTIAPTATVGYIGGNVELLRLVGALRAALGHTGELLVDQRVLALSRPDALETRPATCVPVPLRALVERADLFVIDLAMHGFPRTRTSAGLAMLRESKETECYMRALRTAFIVCVTHEQTRRASGQGLPRKFLLVSSQGTWFDDVAAAALGLVLTPYATHVRHGFLRDTIALATKHEHQSATRRAAARPAPVRDPAHHGWHPPASIAWATEAPARRLSAQPRSIVLVAPGPPPDRPVGLAAYTYTLASALRARGHAVRVLYAERDRARSPGTLREGHYDGLATTSVSVRPDAIHGFADEQIATVLTHYLADLDAQVLHAHDLQGISATALRAGKALGLRTVLTAHDAWLVCEQRHFVHADGRLCARRPDAVAACVDCALARYPEWRARTQERGRLHALLTERQAHLRSALAWVDTLIVPSRFIERLLAAYDVVHPRAFLAPPGLPPFAALPRRPHGGPLRCTYVGELSHAAGVDLLIQAFRHIAPARAQLALYGEARDVVFLDRALGASAPGPNVAYWGAYADDELPAILADTDLIVVPAREPGYPAVIAYPSIVERCRQAGVPIIAAAVGPLAELVRDGEDGLLFRAGDEADLAAKLRACSDDPHLVAALRQRIRPVESLEAHVARLEALYDATLAAPSGTPAEPPLGIVSSEGSAALERALEAFAAGQAHLAAGRSEEARRALQQALDLNPLLATAHYLLGCIDLEAGQAERALPALRRAVELAPGEADFHNALGAALHQVGDAAGAEAALRQALACDETRADIWSNMGDLYAAQGCWRDAVAAYERAIALGADDAALVAQLQTARSRAGRPAGDATGESPVDTAPDRAGAPVHRDSAPEDAA